jgi:hypothetical protein
LPDGIFFKPKIAVWIYFGGPWNRKYWYIVYGHLEYLPAIWNILWSFGTFLRFVMVYGEKSGNPALLAIRYGRPIRIACSTD